MISPEEVAKLAALARIEVAPAEQENLRRDLSAILDYVSELKAATAVENSKSGLAPAPALTNVWREDVPAPQTDATRERLRQAAPQSAGGYFKVKKILG